MHEIIAELSKVACRKFRIRMLVICDVFQHPTRNFELLTDFGRIVRFIFPWVDIALFCFTPIERCGDYVCLIPIGAWLVG